MLDMCQRTMLYIVWAHYMQRSSRSAGDIGGGGLQTSPWMLYIVWARYMQSLWRSSGDKNGGSV